MGEVPNNIAYAKDLAPGVKSVFEAYGESLDRLVHFQKLIETSCVIGGELDPLSCNELSWKNVDAIADYFLQIRLTAAAEQILQAAWNRFAAVQREKGKRVYRATFPWWLANACVSRGDSATAFRWCLLGHADDVLDNNSGSSRSILQTHFGMSAEEIHRFTQKGDELREKAKGSPCGWSTPGGFAEEVLREFSSEDEHGSTMLAKAASHMEFPVCPAYLDALLSEALKRGDEGDTTEYGNALERVASYLVSLMPGCVPWSNVWEKGSGKGQTDVVVVNLAAQSHLGSDLLGRQFLVECKNTKDKEGVSNVGYFLYRMRLLHVDFGIFISRSGITDDASLLIQRAFHEDRSICVHISLEDVLAIAKGKVKSFWWMIFERANTLRFGVRHGISKRSK